MKGIRVVWPAPGKVELEEFTLPSLEPTEVLIGIEYSVISAGTEKAWLTGMPNTGNKFPMYPGYSSAGRILATGTSVDNLRVGDKVACHYTGHASHAVKPASETKRIDDPHISTKEAAFLEIASISMQGLRKARLELGESVVVMGQGLLGLLAVQLARLSGALPVIATDLNEERRQLALEVGADHVLDPCDPQFVDRVRDLTDGRMANAVIESTGVSLALNQSLSCTARQGRIVLLGCTRVNDTAVDFYRDVHLPGITLIGAHQFVRPQRDSYPGYWTRSDEFGVLLRLLSADRLRISPLISTVIPADKAPKAYKCLVNNPHPPIGMVLDWRDCVV